MDSLALLDRLRRQLHILSGYTFQYRQLRLMHDPEISVSVVQVTFWWMMLHGGIVVSSSPVLLHFPCLNHSMEVNVTIPSNLFVIYNHLTWSQKKCIVFNDIAGEKTTLGRKSSLWCNSSILTLNDILVYLSICITLESCSHGFLCNISFAT